jgi:glycosyltransferase involved in cell wall biosynthesis
VNILYHHRTLADGAEGIHIHEMIEAFRALGHHVIVEAMARPAEAGTGRGGVIAAVRRRLPQALFECAGLALNLRDYAVTSRHLRKDRIDLVYTRHALLDIGTSLAARRQRVPVVLEVNTAYSAPSVTQFEPLQLLSMARGVERRALRSATVIVAVSTPLAGYLQQLAGPGLPILTLPNGVNPRRFDPDTTDRCEVRRRYGLQDRFVVGWAGVLRRWHGVEILLDALVLVPDAYLLLIGDGPDRPLIEKLAGERGLSDRVTITGRVRHQDMPLYLAAIDVAVAAADQTGFASPMKVVEYMAMGRPVVAPRLQNLRDLLEDDRTALFFTPGDAGDLARAIKALQRAPQLRERLSRAARATVVERRNWRRNAEAVLEAVARAGGRRSES